MRDKVEVTVYGDLSLGTVEATHEELKERLDELRFELAVLAGMACGQSQEKLDEHLITMRNAMEEWIGVYERAVKDEWIMSIAKENERRNGKDEAR